MLDCAPHPRRSARPRAALVAAIAWFAGCAGVTPAAEAGTFDVPVPADEPRATVVLALELRASQDCEEAFDLAMYGDEGIELIEWDDHAGRCKDRKARVRFLSRRTSGERVLEQAAKFAAKAEARDNRAGSNHE